MLDLKYVRQHQDEVATNLKNRKVNVDLTKLIFLDDQRLDLIGQVEAMRQNPDVTVRDRGVMEKCTYCVQRIERVRIEARVAGRPIKDGEIKTACQQACPTQALTFGSLHDSNSAVSRLHKDERRYDLLHELNTRPRTGYLVRLKNPNPELA